MATEAKRSKLDGDVHDENNDNDVKTDAKLQAFMKWMTEKNITISEKVFVSKQGSCAQYGLIASCDIDEGECLFEIPRSAILWQENNGVKELINKEISSLQNESGWVPLLVALLYEYLNPNSSWRSYLDIVPDYSELDHPMFWDRSEMSKELQGTGIIAAVEQDLQKMRQEYDGVVSPFLQKFPKQFGPEASNFELYMKLVAFVMAYSFTDPISVALERQKADGGDEAARPRTYGCNPPMMVPLADILNHVAKNNAHLKFGIDSLRMCSVKPIKKGEEIFNTYGELSNAELLHMYGFAEPHPNNHYDVVEIPIRTLLQEYEKETSSDDKPLLNDKLDFLKSLDLITDDGHFVIGHEGILTEDELYHTLKVLHMDEKAFKDHKDKEGWSDDDVNSLDNENMSNEALGKLPNSWKELLRKAVNAHQTGYNTTLEDDEALLKPEKLETLTRRQKWALHVRYGQKKLLEKFIQFLD